MSAKSKSTSIEGTMKPGWLKAARFFLLAAMAVDGYLIWVAAHGGGVAGCGPDSACDKVLHSRWSSWLGIPVSAPAMLVYLVTLVATFRLGARSPTPRQRKAWRILIPCAVLIAGAAIWFATLQIAVIGSVCPFCMTAHGCGLAASVVLLMGAPVRRAAEKPWQQEKLIAIPLMQFKRLLVTAALLLAVLVGGQVLYRPKMFAVQSVSNGGPAGSNSGPARFFQVYNGLFQFNLSEVPIFGSPNASNVIVSLYDYTCPHCRDMHVFLDEARYVFSNELAIVSLPVPLDATCNYTVKKTPAVHTNGCEYAKLGLAVWRANRAALPGFDTWIFAPARPPSLEESKQFAAELVGTNALEKALQDSWVKEQLNRNIALYATNYLHLGKGTMPQLIIGSKLTAGHLQEVKELYQLLADNLGLKKEN